MKLTSKRQIACLLIILVFIVAAIPATAENSWRFVSMADSRGDTNGVNVQVFGKIIDLVNSENPDLVLFEGDAFSGSKDDNGLISQMDTWLSVINRLNCSWYYSTGNHEIITKNSEMLVKSKIKMPMNGPSAVKELVYSFDHNNAHFVCLDSNKYGDAHRIQADWLASDLKANKKPHIFVFAHEPAYPSGPHIGSSLDKFPVERDVFWSLLVKSGVGVYFCGHEHLYARSSHKGVLQIISGTCGAPIYSGFKGTIGAYHYVVVDVFKDHVSGVAKDDSGKVIDSWSYQLKASR